MLSIYSTFQVTSLSYLIKKTDLAKSLDATLQKVEINKVKLGRLLVKLQRHHADTFQHSLNVANLTYYLGREIKLNGEELIKISMGALFHDIGKLLVDLKILDKPGKLTVEEWKIMRQHPRLGVNLLRECGWTEELTLPVLYHHEWIDGSGYEGLTGSQIPLGARIIALVDSFDAMIFDRPYRTGLLLPKSIIEIQRQSGSQFDPELVKYFLRILEKLQSRTKPLEETRFSKSVS